MRRGHCSSPLVVSTRVSPTRRIYEQTWLFLCRCGRRRHSVDDVAHKLDAASDDEGDSEDAGSNGSIGNTEAAGETVNSAM